jgi:hypothetical protein
MAGELHLVGSIPFHKSEDIFQQFGGALGDFLFDIAVLRWDRSGIASAGCIE